MTKREDEHLEEAALWLSRMRGADLHPEQASELKAWLALDPGNAAALDLVLETWDQAGALAHTPVVKKEIERLEQRNNRKALTQWSVGIGGLVAAGLAVAILNMPSEQTFRTKVGEVTSLTLADHSTVWLDTDTVMKVKFSQSNRRVSLERGAAEFQVAHNATRPFSVSIPDAQIRDVGTDFSVRLDGDRARVVLVSGAVDIKRADGASEADLQPGQALLIPQTGPMAFSKTDPQADMAWRQGRLVFYRRPLAEVVAEFGRYEPIKVRFADPAAAQISVSGTYRAKDFSSFLTAINALYGIHFYTADDAEIVIRSRG